jgi:hypothetical protein
LNTARPETPPYPIPIPVRHHTQSAPPPYHGEGVSCFSRLWFTSRPLIARCGPSFPRRCSIGPFFPPPALTTGTLFLPGSAPATPPTSFILFYSRVGSTHIIRNPVRFDSTRLDFYDTTTFLTYFRLFSSSLNHLHPTPLLPPSTTPPPPPLRPPPRQTPASTLVHPSVVPPRTSWLKRRSARRATCPGRQTPPSSPPSIQMLRRKPLHQSPAYPLRSTSCKSFCRWRRPPSTAATPLITNPRSNQHRLAVSGSPSVEVSFSLTSGSCRPSISVCPLPHQHACAPSLTIIIRLPHPPDSMASHFLHNHDPDLSAYHHPPRWAQEGQDDGPGVPEGHRPHWRRVQLELDVREHGLSLLERLVHPDDQGNYAYN